MTNDTDITVSAGYLSALEKKVSDLSVLLDISEIISSTLDLDRLMDLVMEKAKKELEAEACSILFYNKNTNRLEFEVALCRNGSTENILKETVSLEMGQGIAGWVAQNLQPIVIDDVTKDARFFSGADEKTGFKTRSLIAIPLVGRSGLIGVAEIINNKRTDYDPEILKLMCRQFAIAIENAQLYRESLKRERARQELEIAATLQKSFLPEAPCLSTGSLGLSAVNISASQVGGDLYDFVSPAEGKTGILIGDVSGKGVSAALYMAKAVSDFRYAARSGASASEVFNLLNPLLIKSPRGMFLTAAYVIIEHETGSAEIASAGHPPLIWLSGDEAKVLSLASGPPLGIVPASYNSTVIRLNAGDRLLMFTDGLFEAKDTGGNRIGFKKIVDFVNSHASGADLIGGLTSYVAEFERGAERADDITIVQAWWDG